MRTIRYEYSSTQANLPKDLADKIIHWGKKHIQEDELYLPEDPGYGREEEIHVTVLYGLHDTSPDRLQDILESQPPFKVRLGKTSTFSSSSSQFDVLKLDVESNDLHRINKLLRDNFKFSNNFKVYRPHVTIAYLKKGQATKHSSDSSFKGTEFTVKEIVFSSKTGSKTRLPLRGKPAS